MSTSASLVVIRTFGSRCDLEPAGEEAFSNYLAELKIVREYSLHTCLPGCGDDEFVSTREQVAFRARWAYGAETKTDRVTHI